MDGWPGMDDGPRMADVVLAEGRDRIVRRRHPWVLSGAVARVEGHAAPGDWVRVRAHEGEVIGHGHLAPDARLRVRLLSIGKEAEEEEPVLAERLHRAVARRASDPLLADTDAVRLVNAEGDGLPGLVADRYADVVVVRASSAGMLRCTPFLAQRLRLETGAAVGLVRDDAVAARREGFAARHHVLWGDAPEAPVAVEERGRRFRVDVRQGQKTGFYLDQRETRDLVSRLARGRRVLDLFSYTGGFSVAAAQGGASAVTLVDSSREALARAEGHLDESAPGLARRLVHDDAFEFLRADGSSYDLLVLDPPPLARRHADLRRAARGHKDLLIHALRRAAPGAFLLHFSCSHAVDAVLLRQVLFAASLDAGRPVQVLGTLAAPSDHPVSVDHPEGQYLTGLLVRA